MTLVFPPGTFDFLTKPKAGIHVDGTVPEKLRKMRGGISAKQLAPILGVSAVTVYRMAERKGIPSYRLGTKLLFDPTVIADWLDGG
jgi:excisionase family DNA binding protein